MIEAVATLLSVGGAIGVARASSRAVGFALWTVANLAWVMHGIAVADPYLTGLFGVYEGTSIYGLWSELGEPFRGDL